MIHEIMMEMSLSTLILLMVVRVVQMEGTDPTTEVCVNDSQPISVTYWTDWYSSEGSLTNIGEEEDFSQICLHIVETECRERYTHRSLADTHLNFQTACENGVLICVNKDGSSQGERQICVDMEMRLKCLTPIVDPLPEPDFHWSLSELDSGNTRGAIEPWQCGGRPLVKQVNPIKGNLFGYVDGEGMQKRYSHVMSQFTRCAVLTNGLSSLSFEPFVRSCLTDLACCDSTSGITVSFWLYKKEKVVDNISLSQEIPLHVFRSPYLIATLQEGHLIVSCHHDAEASTLRAEIEESNWEFVTIICGPREGDLKVYVNRNDALESKLPQGAWSSLDEFRAANASFQVLTTEGSDNVTSSDIRPVAITALRIYNTALSAEDVKRVFDTEQGRELPPKIIRMNTQEMQFNSFTQENVKHIWLKCLIRLHTENTGDEHDETRLRIRFMYTNDAEDEQFKEMTSNDFKMRIYRERHSSFQIVVSAQILGRHDGGTLPQYFTCDAAADSIYGNISSYGFEIINIQSSTQLVEPYYYWTKFFDMGPPADDGVESEKKTSHQEQANEDGYDLLCDKPVYAECRVKAKGGDPAVPWYDAEPSFIPQFEFPCDGNGIHCESQVDHTTQTCPDLEVRYACRNTTVAVTDEIEVEETNTGDSDPSSDSRQPSDTEQLPSSDDGHLPNSGQPSNIHQPNSDSGQKESNLNTEQAPTSNNDDSTSRITTADRQAETNGINKKSFDKVIKDNLNWIYPFLIVFLGTGIPIVIACFFLCRKKTPEEIEREKLAAEKKKEAAMLRPTSAGEKA